jgi:Cdc6-like AAA superfamily ATPase
MGVEELFFPPHDQETLKEILRQRGAEEEAHEHSHPRTHTPAISIFLGIGESALGVSEGKFTAPAA